LRFPGVARGDSLKETDGARLPVNGQFKLLAIQAIDEVSVLIEYRYRRLHQLGLEAQYVVFLRFRLWLLGINQRSSQERCQANAEYS
jgi:hypothetical protein